LIDGFYAHLPLKRAMYAVDPLRGLHLLRLRLRHYGNDRHFHAEISDIFRSMRDRHTAYALPAPYNDAASWLPFKIESYFDGQRHRYLVTHIANWFMHSSFRKGVELLHWNGVPIARAVELAGAESAGNSPEARHALGLQILTARALEKDPPSDAEWVTVRYRSPSGGEHEIQIKWAISNFAGGRQGKFNRIDQVLIFLFSPELMELDSKLAAARNPLSLIKGMQSQFSNFRA
jgi:hypothetical protein